MMRNLFLVLLFFIVNTASAQAPIINNYQADLTIYKNAEMTVTETINVTTDGHIIKRGIFRDFPTRYKTKQGANFNIGFQLISVKLDGKDEPFFIKQLSNGVRIYVGQKSKLLPPGTYTYVLHYSVNRAIGFFDQHDEIYWNVTGNDWAFPITKASATLTLPSETNITKATAYTGDYGSRSNNVTITYPEKGMVTWVTQAPLSPRQGLTVVAAWPKGIITQPTLSTEIGYFARDNTAYVIAIIGFILVLGFYCLAWFYMGRDPKAKAVIPLFSPPKDFSPQALRYIKKMRYDNKMFTAAIVNMAVKKHITISNKKKKTYTLIKENNDTSQLTAAELALSNALFEKKTKIVISQDNQPTIAKAVKSFKSQMKKEYENKYFIRNSAIIIIGAVISLLSVFPLIQTNVESIIPLIISAVVMFVLVKTVIKIQDNYQDFGFSWAFLTSFSASSIVGVALLIFFFHSALQGMLLQLGIVGLFVIVNTVFYYLMKRPTLAGAKVIQEAKGFELFLKATEEDRLNFRNPPSKTPELFEALLPFALALGLEQAWSNQFANILAQSQYQPTWYTGHHYGDFNPTNFSQSVGSSLNSAISSASVAPGSNSGFSSGGGGGFSGGGGGGGGGGGW